MNSVTGALSLWLSALPEARALPFLAEALPFLRLNPGMESVSVEMQGTPELGRLSPPLCLSPSSGSRTVPGKGAHPWGNEGVTISGMENGQGLGLSLGSENTCPECPARLWFPGRWPRHAHAHTDTHAQHPPTHSPHTQCTHPHPRTDPHTTPHTQHTPTHTDPHTPPHICTYTHPHPHIPPHHTTHAHIHTHPHTHPHHTTRNTHPHPQTPTHAYAHIHTHKHTDSQTHICTHRQTHRHIHKHFFTPNIS